MREFDDFETQEQSRANFNFSSKGVSHDSTRVLGRDRIVRTDIKSTDKNKRRPVH